MNKLKRRWRYLAISPSVFGYIFRKGTYRILKSPIPKDAKYIAAHYDHSTDEILVLFYHRSFEIVKEGYTIPKISGSEIEVEVGR